jgi:hypothetical protein
VTLRELGCNYLYRYGTLVVRSDRWPLPRKGHDEGRWRSCFAPGHALQVMCDYLLESKALLQQAATAEDETAGERELDFPKWLEAHREITSVLSRRSLD